MSMPGTTPKALGSNYVFTGSAHARDLFNQRTVEEDAPLVAQHLRPGMRVVDFGCGAGSLTCGFARMTAPGDVLGGRHWPRPRVGRTIWSGQRAISGRRHQRT